MLSKFLLRNKNSESGAAGVLPLMISTFGGALFLFTFYNLTQYTSARSAADQAARRAARCLSPTDAECRDQIFDPNSNQANQNWYGYNKAQGPTTILTDNYTYSGQVFHQNLGARYSSFEVQTGNPVVMHTQKAVKPVRYYGLLNSYQLLKADLQITIQNRVTGETKLCRLFEAVELPAGVRIENEAIYTDDRWCNAQSRQLSTIAQAPGCSDANNGEWQLASQGYCRIVPPLERRGDLGVWLLLGGSPVCDGAPEAPYSEIPQTLEEVRNLAPNYFGSQAEPGTTGRAHSVTKSRQFVVVEVFSCNPDAFKDKLKNLIKNKDDLKKYFVSYPQRGLQNEGDQNNPDFNGTSGTSAFVYLGAPGVTYLAESNWTYFEWTRQATGSRHLERKVCEWLTFDEVRSKYGEFNTGAINTYLSGKEYGSEAPTYTFYDVPSCLQSTSSDQSYTCPNRTIAGQTGSFLNCAGWDSQENQIEVSYSKNLEKALALNQNQSWVEFETLPTEFDIDIQPYYSQAYASPAWEFSWSNSDFYGNAITNPAAVRDRNGINPKELMPSNFVKSVVRTDGVLDLNINEKLKQAIAMQEQAPISPNISFSVVDTGIEEATPIQGVWPFIKDQNGNPMKTVRPYFGNPAGFDYDLDCIPDNSCQMGLNHNTLDEALRYFASQVVPDVNLRDPVYKFEYTEQQAGVEFLDRAVSGNYPACTQFRTLCQDDVGDGNKIFLGSSPTMPAACRNGTYVNCYADYANSQIQSAVYNDSLQIDKAKLKALAEVRKLIPQASLCDSLANPNCVTVDILQSGKEIQVAVNFSAQLTTPFKEMLSQDTLLVSGKKREIIELERLKD